MRLSVNAFTFQGRIHAIMDGKVYVYLGESIVDQVVALASIKFDIERPKGSWALVLSATHLEAVSLNRLAALRKDHGPVGVS